MTCPPAEDDWGGTTVNNVAMGRLIIITKRRVTHISERCNDAQKLDTKKKRQADRAAQKAEVAQRAAARKAAMGCMR